MYPVNSSINNLFIQPVIPEVKIELTERQVNNIR